MENEMQQIKITEHPLVLVEWYDTNSYPLWYSEDEEFNCIRSMSIGCVLTNNDEKLVITHMRNEEGKCSDVLVIPRGSIKSVLRFNFGEKQHEETNECDVKSKGGKIVKES